MRISIRAAVKAAAATILLSMMSVFSAQSVPADPVADFYKGRSFEIHVGFAAGGGYDRYARFLSRFMGRHIPGKPDIVVRNKPGGATIKLTNILYNVGPFDGSVMGMVARGIPTHELLGGKGAKYDPTKFNWVGSMNNEVSVCMLSTRAKARSFSELLTNEVIVGGQGATSDADVFTTFLQNLTGAKLKLITGFPGTAVTVLALDRGEVDGMCGWSWGSVIKMRGNDVKSGKIFPVLQMALKKHDALPNIPLITDIARNESQLKQMELLFSRQTIGRPFALPPKVPADRVKAIRAAFAKTMQDPDFVAQAKKTRTEIQWESGDKVQELIERVLRTPKEIVAEARANLNPKGPVQKAKLTYISAKGTIAAVKRGGRRIELLVDGKKIKTNISGSRTKITIAGKKAKRKAFKTGMACTISYLGPGTVSRSVDCQ